MVNIRALDIFKKYKRVEYRHFLCVIVPIELVQWRGIKEMGHVVVWDIYLGHVGSIIITNNQIHIVHFCMR